MLKDAYGIYTEQGLQELGRIGIEYALLRSPLASRLSRALYWSFAPFYYRYQDPTGATERSQSLDPFKIERVSPERIERFTRRCYPPWWNRAQLFGAVKDGDWDRRPHEQVPVFNGPPRELFVGKNLSSSPLYRSLEKHFTDGVKWTETEFIREVLRLLDNGMDQIWHNCDDKAAILDRCRELDRIYDNMREQGCKSYRERTAPWHREVPFINALEREIVVDIGRNGELLLVSGKHRVFLAKIIGLESVPVVFLVRHANWMQKRQSARFGSAPESDHPDLRTMS